MRLRDYCYFCNVKADFADIFRRWMRGDAAVWCLCFAVSFCASAYASADSPFTHTALGHIDTAWFMDAGRWLMRGLTPYEDFADSKGPLLWLFFGLGYLLDNDGWTGMFVLFALYSVFVYRFVWLSAMEILGSRKAATFVVLFMPLAFLGFGHAENRAEDLLQLPLAYFIYLVIRAFKGKEITFNQYVLTGVAMGCMLFVKWNFPAMLLPLPVIMLCYDARRHSRAGGTSTFGYAMSRLALALAGVAAVALCVIALVAALGGLQGMSREYFANTLYTLHFGDVTTFGQWWHSVQTFFLRYKFVVMTLLVVPVVACRMFGRKGLWLFVALVWMLFICFLHFLPHYVRAVDTFGLFVAVAICLLIQRFGRLRLWMVLIEIPLGAGYLYYSLCLTQSGFGNNPQGASFFRMCERVDSIDNPRILYFGCGDISLGISSNALPACRYWAFQYGGSPDMYAMQHEAIEQHTADIVVTERDDFTPEKYGYHTCDGDLFCCPLVAGSYYRVHWSPHLRRANGSH